MAYFNQFDLCQIDSFQCGSRFNQNFHSDLYYLNKTLSGRNNQGFDLVRQSTNMSQAGSTVGNFNISKNALMNQAGEVIVSQSFGVSKLEDQNQEINDMKEMEEMMWAQSIPYNQKLNHNSLLQGNFSDIERNQMNISEYNLPVGMTSSQEVDKNIYSALNKNLYSQSSRQVFNNLLEQSSSMRHQINQQNYYPLNINQLQNEHLLTNSNFQKLMYPAVCLMGRRIETQSEPDKDPLYFDEFSTPTHNHYNNNEVNQLQINNKYEEESNSNSNNDSNSFSHLQKSQNLGIKMEAFTYMEKSIIRQDVHSAHSEEEQPVHTALNKIKKISKVPQQSGKPSRDSKYRQSRHKNVFKNFGGTLIRFIIYNQHFQERVMELVHKDASKQKGFQNWLQTNVKLERKKDFQIAWTTFKTDSEDIREYKEILRELSRDFFENFSFIYLINSKKISDMEIHLRSIHTYLAAINNPDSLERFKPV